MQEDIKQALLPFCIELGWLKWENNEPVDWKVVDIDQEAAIDYLVGCGYDRSDAEEVVSKNIIKYETIRHESK